MDTVNFERLLYEEESTTLDFKKEQYRFAKATEDEKSELLKDILGFANAWRRSDSYILIGVEEVRGGRSIVHGVSEQLQDHSVQQFVNANTNRPIQFAYEAFEFDQKQVGVIRIEQQQRPIYLKRDYGKLQKDKVYVRRGSSTDPMHPAGPDEIAMMGSGQASALSKATLIVEFADATQELSLGNRIGLATEYCRMPKPSEIPTVSERESRRRKFKDPLLGNFQIPQIATLDLHGRKNDRYYHELAKYEFCKRLYRRVRMVVSNIGDVPAAEVRIEMSIPANRGTTILRPSKFPDEPKRQNDMFGASAIRDMSLRPAFRHPGYLNIAENQNRYKIEVDCGNLQPGRKVWSDHFYVGFGTSIEAQLSGIILAANLPSPQDFMLTIDANVSETNMTLDELTSLPDSR